MKTQNRRLYPSVALAVVLLCTRAPAETQALAFVSLEQPAGTISLSLANELNAATDRGLDWLAARQHENGTWSNEAFPALTALPLQAFLRGTHPRKDEIVDRAVQYILSCVQDDGGIYRKSIFPHHGGLTTYNTAVCMTALYETGRPSLIPAVRDARAFLAESQYLGDDTHRGAFGYERGQPQEAMDLISTFQALEAMRVTRSAEDTRDQKESRVDLQWEVALKYIERMQADPAAGTANGATALYSPEARPGDGTNAAAVVAFRNYGSMTYAGLLSLIYADVSRRDPRVRSAFDWAARHWSLDENPGMGARGLFFFYYVLTKALTAYNQDLIALPDGTFLNWRAALAEKLVGLQTIDPRTGQGHWENPVGQFWESDPVFVTAYAILAAEML